MLFFSLCMISNVRLYYYNARRYRSAGSFDCAQDDKARDWVGVGVSEKNGAEVIGVGYSI